MTMPGGSGLGSLLRLQMSWRPELQSLEALPRAADLLLSSLKWPLEKPQFFATWTSPQGCWLQLETRHPALSRANNQTEKERLGWRYSDFYDISERTYFFNIPLFTPIKPDELQEAVAQGRKWEEAGIPVCCPGGQLPHPSQSKLRAGCPEMLVNGVGMPGDMRPQEAVALVSSETRFRIQLRECSPGVSVLPRPRETPISRPHLSLPSPHRCRCWASGT